MSEAPPTWCRLVRALPFTARSVAFIARWLLRLGSGLLLRAATKSLGNGPVLATGVRINGGHHMSASRDVVVTVAGAAVLLLVACGRNDTPAPPPATSASPGAAPATERVVGPLSADDARALATMNDRIK